MILSFGLWSLYDATAMVSFAPGLGCGSSSLWIQVVIPNKVWNHKVWNHTRKVFEESDALQKMDGKYYNGVLQSLFKIDKLK